MSGVVLGFVLLAAAGQMPAPVSGAPAPAPAPAPAVPPAPAAPHAPAPAARPAPATVPFQPAPAPPPPAAAPSAAPAAPAAPAPPPPSADAIAGEAVLAAYGAVLAASPMLTVEGHGRGREPGRTACVVPLLDPARASEAVGVCTHYARVAGAHRPEVELAAAWGSLRAGQNDAGQRLAAWLDAHTDPRELVPWARVLAGEAAVRSGDLVKAEALFQRALLSPGELSDRAAALRLASLVRMQRRGDGASWLSRASAAPRGTAAEALAAAARAVAATQP